MNNFPLMHSLSFKMLLENRVDFLKKYYEDKHAKARNDFGLPFFNSLVDADPSRNKVYLQWLINQCFLKTSGRLLDEDVYKVKDALIVYDRIKRQFSKKDINQYKEYRDLVDEADKLSDSKSGKEIKKDEMTAAMKESEVVYKGSEGSIIIPKTEKASCILGRGTKWCTAATSRNMFQYYNRNGNLYIIQTRDNKKWQFHLYTGQLMDDKDRPVKFEDFDEWYPWVFNKIKFTDSEIVSALLHEGRRIQYIKNPSEKYQAMALGSTNSALKYIKNPSENVILKTLERNPTFIGEISNPSEKIQFAAIKNNSYMIQFIKNPTTKVLLTAIKSNGNCIRVIKNPTETMINIAISSTPNAISHIKNPTEKQQLLAVNTNPDSIFEIDYPTYNVQMAAVKKNPKSYQYIRNPHPDITEYVKGKR